MSNRHPINLESARESFSLLWRDWPELKELAKRNPKQVYKCAKYALELTGYLCLFEPESKAIPHLLTYAADGILAHYQLAQVAAGEIEVRLVDEVFRLPGFTHGPSFISPDVWLQGFWAAAMARRRSALEGLCQIPEDVFRQARGVQSPSYLHLFVRALGSFLLGSSEAFDLDMAAMDATEPDQLIPGTELYVLSIDVFPIEAVGWVIGQQSESLNDCLLRGIESHREFHDSNEGYRRQDPLGFVSVPLTAIAAMAHDMGFPIEVESDYLPQRLIRGDWRTDNRSIYLEPFPGGRALSASDAEPFMDAVRRTSNRDVDQLRERLTESHIPLLIPAWKELNWEQRYSFMHLMTDEKHSALRPLMLEVIRHGDATEDDAAWAMAVALTYFEGDQRNFNKYFKDREAARQAAVRVAKQTS